jgi:hypothetical protein
MYVTTKSTTRNEWRVYVDNPEIKPEGEILYKGHRMGITTELLVEILESKVDVSKSTIYILRYEKMEAGVTADVRNLQIWKPVRQEHVNTELMDTWLNISDGMRKQFGNHNKIIVSRINI